jgi:hypothetical protein
MPRPQGLNIFSSLRNGGGYIDRGVYRGRGGHFVGGRISEREREIERGGLNIFSSLRNGGGYIDRGVYRGRGGHFVGGRISEREREIERGGLNIFSSLRKGGGYRDGVVYRGRGGHFVGGRISEREIEIERREREIEIEIEIERERSLASGVNNAGSSRGEGPWFEISSAIRDWSYFTDEKIDKIIELTTEGLNRPLQLSKILNHASNARNNALQKIINGWGDDKLSVMLETVIDQVGNRFNKDGSQSISLIFNALSKVEGDGRKVKEFYDKIGDSQKWPKILDNASTQTIANIFNALSKISGKGKEVREFYNEIGEGKWPKIIDDAKVQEISNILNALSKVEDGGLEVRQFYDKIGEGKWKQIIWGKEVTPQNISNILSALSKAGDDGNGVKSFYDIIGPDLFLKSASDRDLVVNIGVLADSKQCDDKLEEIYNKIPSKSELFKRMIEDKDLNNIRAILVSFSKSPKAHSFLEDLCEHKSWSKKQFNKSDESTDFINVIQIMRALNQVQDDGALLKQFYDRTKNLNYTKTGDLLVRQYGWRGIENGEAILLDLHRFGHEEASIVIKLFLEDRIKDNKEFYIEFGRSTHNADNKGKMEGVARAVLEKAGFEGVRTDDNKYSFFKVRKKIQVLEAPSTSTNLGRGVGAHGGPASR